MDDFECRGNEGVVAFLKYYDEQNFDAEIKNNGYSMDISPAFVERFKLRLRLMESNLKVR